jgi:hypothetical protein
VSRRWAYAQKAECRQAQSAEFGRLEAMMGDGFADGGRSIWQTDKRRPHVTSRLPHAASRVREELPCSATRTPPRTSPSSQRRHLPAPADELLLLSIPHYDVSLLRRMSCCSSIRIDVSLPDDKKGKLLPPPFFSNCFLNVMLWFVPYSVSSCVGSIRGAKQKLVSCSSSSRGEEEASQ